MRIVDTSSRGLPLTLREAREEELPQLVELWLEMMHEHEDFEPRVELSSEAHAGYHSYLLLHHRSRRSLVALAEHEGEPVAFCTAYVCQNLPVFKPAEFGFISDLAVSGALRRHGIGKRLLDHVFEWFRSRGVDNVQLQVYERNVNGRAFWESQGFEPFFQRLWRKL